jgi:hypothetical protein
VSDDTGRNAALEAIGDMLMVLDMPVMRFAALMREINQEAPGHPQLWQVQRKARGVAERIGDLSAGAQS